MNTLYCIFCFILVSSGLYCQKNEDSNFNQLYSAGNILFNQGNYDKAIKEFNKILIKNPNDENALYSIGWSFYNKGDYKMAIEYFTKSLKGDDHLFGSYYGRAACYKMLEENDKEEKDYKKLIEINPNFYMAYKNLGVIEKERGNKELALDYFNKAIQAALPEKHDFLYLNRALLESKMLNFKESNEDLNMVLLLNPNHKMAYVDLGYNYIELQDYSNAILNFSKYLEIDKDPKYFIERAFCEKKLGKIRECCEDLNTAKNLGLSKADEYIKNNCNNQKP